MGRMLSPRSRLESASSVLLLFTFRNPTGEPPIGKVR